MEVITFILGCLIGFIFAVISIKKLLIGKLRIIWDPEEQQPYMFMELSKPDVTEVASKKYVVLKVNEGIDFSQK